MNYPPSCLAALHIRTPWLLCEVVYAQILKSSKAITSRCHDSNVFCCKQKRIPFKMASLSITSLLSFFSEETKSIKKGENHYKSEHVEAFTYQQGVLRRRSTRKHEKEGLFSHGELRKVPSFVTAQNFTALNVFV